MKILTIGNSFANNATMYLDQLVAPYPNIELILGKINLGGCSLEKHWNLVGQCDLLKDVKPYNFQVTGKGPRPATLLEGLVGEHRLHPVLAVGEGAFDGDVVDVSGWNGGHLAALDVGNPSPRVEDEDLDGGAVAAGLDGG